MARDNKEEDSDDLMQGTRSMLMAVGTVSVAAHGEANELRKVLLMCGGNKAVVLATVIEIYYLARVAAVARRRLDLNVDGGMSFDSRSAGERSR